jgi:hypothetical protein
VDHQADAHSEMRKRARRLAPRENEREDIVMTAPSDTRDGYRDGTALCQVHGTVIDDWFQDPDYDVEKLKHAMVKPLRAMGIVLSSEALMRVGLVRGEPHPALWMGLALWVSPDLAAWVSPFADLNRVLHGEPPPIPR